MATLVVDTVPLREQVRDSVEFVRIVWEEIEQSLRDQFRPCLWPPNF
jgi:hypothetical protein